MTERNEAVLPLATARAVATAALVQARKAARDPSCTEHLSDEQIRLVLRDHLIAASADDLDSACAFLDLVGHGTRWMLHNPSRDPWQGAKDLPVAEMIIARAKGFGWTPSRRGE